MDAADNHQNNLENNVSKMRLEKTGRELDLYKGKLFYPLLYFWPSKDIHLEDIKGPGYCGSCQGLKIQDQSGKLVCCNSCSSVFAAHEHMGVEPPKMEDIEQCRLENWPILIKEHASEGCRMSGSLEVNKVSGNFHFAAGKSFDIKGHHLHDIRFLEGMNISFDHKIHSLSFGTRHGNMKNPLDNTVMNGPASEAQVHTYYVKVVATDFRHLNGTILHTNQYSATKNSHEAPTKIPSTTFATRLYHNF